MAVYISGTSIPAHVREWIVAQHPILPELPGQELLEGAAIDRGTHPVSVGKKLRGGVIRHTQCRCVETPSSFFLVLPSTMSHDWFRKR